MTKDDLPEIVCHFSSMKVHLFTWGLFGLTYENELQWYEKTSEDPDNCIWVIQPEGCDKPIGVTALHGLKSLVGSCTSGIIIWDAKWWGKGIATATHMGRTMFAADFLGRYIIRSEVRTDNVASYKALQRVGYSVWGIEPLSDYRQGRWLDTYRMTWVHPKMCKVLFPEGLPEMFKEGIERARIALDLAKVEVEFP